MYYLQFWVVLCNIKIHGPGANLHGRHVLCGIQQVGSTEAATSLHPAGRVVTKKQQRAVYKISETSFFSKRIREGLPRLSLFVVSFVLCVN